MSTRDLAFATLEQVINRLLDLDPFARQRLARHHGRTIGIHLRGPEINLYFTPDQNGHLLLQSRIEGLPDAVLSGSPLDLLRSSDRQQGARQLFNGNVNISGDSALAHDFGSTLADLDIDWEEQLSRFTGDIIAHQIGNSIRSLAHYGEDSLNRLEQDLGEYLTEESKLLPHPFEVEEFIQEVDLIRDDTERLEARIKHLQQRLEKK